MNELEIIEAIARRWFETAGYDASKSPKWDNQPEQIQAHYRELAERFWRKPGQLFDHLRSAATWARQITTEVNRATAVL